MDSSLSSADPVAVRSAPLRQTAYDALAQKILQGELAPGTRLVEARLSEQLGVSRTPLREALFRLEREGFVRSDKDRGYSVRPLTEREVREVYPILTALEILALEGSAPFVGAVLADLERLNESLGRSQEPVAAIQLDSLWHDTLIAHCSNVRLLAMIAGLRRTIFRYENVYMSDMSLVAQSCFQHRTIIEALRSGDVGRAIEGLKHNYHYGMEAVIRKVVLAQDGA